MQILRCGSIPFIPQGFNFTSFHSLPSISFPAVDIFLRVLINPELTHTFFCICLFICVTVLPKKGVALSNGLLHTQTTHHLGSKCHANSPHGKMTQQITMLGLVSIVLQHKTQLPHTWASRVKHYQSATTNSSHSARPLPAVGGFACEK